MFFFSSWLGLNSFITSLKSTQYSNFIVSALGVWLSGYAIPDNQCHAALCVGTCFVHYIQLFSCPLCALLTFMAAPPDLKYFACKHFTKVYVISLFTGIVSTTIHLLGAVTSSSLFLTCSSSHLSMYTSSLSLLFSLSPSQPGWR